MSARRGGAAAFGAAWLAVLAFGLLGLVAAAPAGAAAGGTAGIVQTDASGPLRSGGSATQFLIQLPSNAHCPGDSAHDQYLINTYVVPSTVNPESVSFVGGQPATGDSIIAVGDTPYEAIATIENSGAMPGFPAFSWIPYAHHTTDLPMGTYNVGVMCADRHGRATTYWNAVVTFTASATDPGGFTWRVDSRPLPAHSSTRGLIIGLVIAVVVIGIAVALLVGRRRPTARSGSLRRA
jgi:hypothetical protein